jgi:3-hydroxyisobutyrate dehydrogenase
LQRARGHSIASPLLDVCQALYTETQALGLGGADMISVIREQRTGGVAP